MNKFSLKKWDEIEYQYKSSAYLDLYSTLGATIWLIESGEFNITNFIEFCNLLESVILFDRLYVTPNPSPAEGRPVGPVDDFTKTLVENDVLSFVKLPEIPSVDKKNLTPSEKLLRKQMGRIGGALSEQFRAEIIEVHLGLSATTIHNLNLQPSVHNRFAYLTTLNIPKSTKSTLSLLNIYRKLSKATETDFTELSKFRSADTFFIPPIPALLLDHISSLKNLAEELLHLRQKFSKVRAAFTEYQKMLQDDSISLKNSLFALKSLKEVGEELSKPYSMSSERIIAEWKDITELLPIDSDFDAEDIKSITKFLVGKPLETVIRTIKKRKFLPLYSLKKDFFKICNLNNLIKKIWGHEVSENDIELFKSYQLDATIIESSIPKFKPVQPPLVLGFDIWEPFKKV